MDKVMEFVQNIDWNAALQTVKDYIVELNIPGFFEQCLFFIRDILNSIFG